MHIFKAELIFCFIYSNVSYSYKISSGYLIWTTYLYELKNIGLHLYFLSILKISNKITDEL